MPAGSKAFLIARCSPNTVGDNSCTRPPRLRRPTPCSPVMVPPRDSAASRMPSNAAWIRRQKSGSSSGGPDDQRVQIAVTGVRDIGDVHVVLARQRFDAGEHLWDVLLGHAHVLGDHRSEPLQGRVGQSAGREQGIGFIGVAGPFGPGRAALAEQLDDGIGERGTGGARHHRPAPAGAPRPRPSVPSASNHQRPAGSTGPSARAPTG